MATLSRSPAAAPGLVGRVDRLVGGPARRRVVVVLACVLSLDSADKGAIGASETYIERAFGVGATKLGVLLSVTSVIGALATVPAGVLVDRRTRTRLLTVAAVSWGVAMMAGAAAPTYGFLLGSRVFLGVVTAVAGPATASLLGDYFPERERANVYGYVLSGELVGAGIGFVVAGFFAALSWRISLLVLAVPALGVAWLVHRLPEPARGGPSRLPTGATELRGAAAIREGAVDPYPANGSAGGGDAGDAAGADPAQEEVRERRVEPHPELVLHEDPTGRPLWWVLRYVLSVRTNVVLIVASALGYFFFNGLSGFAFQFVKQQYGISQALATTLIPLVGVGAVAGAVLGGRFSDRLLRRGRIPARIEVAGVAVLVSAALFVPAFLATRWWVALPPLTAAAFALGASNPPIDAARLDVMQPQLWGRSESVRSLLRTGAQAAAPVLFGYAAEDLFGGPSGSDFGRTFLVMLIALVVAGTIGLVFGRRTYPRDVATMAASTVEGQRA